jgi:hypothetical protein
MRKRKDRSLEAAREDARWFAVSRSVLEGGPRPPMEVGGLKLFGFLFQGECDATVSDDGFFVRFSWNHGPHSYFMDLAPTILGHLLQWSGAVGPCRELRAAPLSPHGLKLLWSRSADFGAGPNEKRLLWLLDDGDQLRFALRVESAELRVAAWPPEIRRPSPAYVDILPPKPCPHCAVALTRVRDLGGAMVCASCGRSFKNWEGL